MHRQGGDVQIANQTADPLYGLHCGTHSRINDSAPTALAWGGTGDQLEPITGQSDVVHTTGIQRQFPKGHKPFPLPLYQVPRIISDL